MEASKMERSQLYVTRDSTRQVEPYVIRVLDARTVFIQPDAFDDGDDLLTPSVHPRPFLAIPGGRAMRGAGLVAVVGKDPAQVNAAGDDLAVLVEALHADETVRQAWLSEHYPGVVFALLRPRDLVPYTPPSADEAAARVARERGREVEHKRWQVEHARDRIVEAERDLARAREDLAQYERELAELAGNEPAEA